MKKTLLLGIALLVLSACKKGTEVKTENTVIETTSDTVHIDTDTISATEVPEMTEDKEVAEKPERAEKHEAAEAPPVEYEKITDKIVAVEYASFGEKITADNALTRGQMLKKYSTLKSGDTVNAKFVTKVKEVCQKKGCWMNLELPGGKESFVKFKDYGFFVPFNAGGQEAVVNGKAFVSEISVAQLRHYAKDGGKSEAEIDKITQPETTYGFLADGVLISK